jgi:DNA replication protein DnaC
MLRDAVNAVGCPECQATPGWKRVGRGVTRCECWIDARRSYAAGVPYEFQASTFENYRQIDGSKKALEIAQAFLDGDRDLFLAGGVGAGKTRLACTILNHAYRLHGYGYFARVPALLLKLQPSRSDDAAEESDRLMHRLEHEPLLVLDDVGAERDSASDYTRRTLLTIYENRCDKRLRTIWTSNLPIAKVAGYQGVTLGEFMGDDRLASRIAGRSQVLWLSSPDQRIRRVPRD